MHGHRRTVDHLIALHAADGGDARHDAGAIGVSEAALDVLKFKLLWVDIIALTDILAELTDIPPKFLLLNILHGVLPCSLAAPIGFWRL